MRKIFLFYMGVFLSFGFSGCGSTGNITLNSLTSVEIKQIEDIELSFLEYWHNHSPSLLSSIERALNNFMKSSIIAKPVKAQLYAMYAELYYYKKEPEQMQKSIKDAELLDAENQRLYITKSIIENNKIKKKVLLETGYKNDREHSLIALFLAELHFTEKEYRLALPYYDEAFQGLPEKYREYYQKNRDLAFHFMGGSNTSAGAADIAGESTLSLGDTARYLLTNTSYLDGLTFDKTIAEKKIITLLIEKAFLSNNDLKADEPLKRKDAAELLLHIIAYLENDPRLIAKTSEKYKRLNKKSPIPDVAVEDYFFDAAFILVEREIMNLPDGINFFPDKTMSGLEFLEIIDRVKTRYGGA